MLYSSNQKEKEKILFLRLTEFQRMSDLVSLAQNCPDGSFEMDVSNFRARKGKRKLERLKQGDFSLQMLVC